MKTFAFRCLFIALTALCHTLAGQAQTTGKHTVITGVLTDSITNEPVPFATVRVFKAGDQRPVAMALTANNGNFTLQVPAPGRYAALFSAVGKKLVQKVFVLTAAQTELKWGTVNTADDAASLQALEVVALKPLVTASPDKLIYDMASDPEAPARNALEMLRKVPMVAVDGQENITVKGSGNFKIYVNGKPNPMMTSNAKEILKNMPASQIAKVEVITDLGAKYDAEGTAGVINIVTVGSQVAASGYAATLTANAGNRSMGGGVNTTVQKGKLTLNANYNYTWMSQSTATYIYGTREDFTDTRNSLLKNMQSNRSPRGNMQMGGLDASYEISKRNLLTLGMQLMGFNMRTKEDVVQEMFNAGGERQYGFSTHIDRRMSNFKTNFHADFQHSFNEVGRMLTFSYNLSTQPGNNDYTNRYATEPGTPALFRDYAQNGHTNFTEHTAQVDYVNPFSTHHYLDAGLKYIDRSNTSEVGSTYLGTGESTADALNSGDYKNRYRIMAAYTDYRYTLGSFSARVGVRYEHSRMTTDFVHQPEKAFGKRYNDVVPSATLSYVPSPTQTLKLAYNMRIQRPSIEMLNPFTDRSNSFSLHAGNPNLDTEKYHAVELSYGSFGAKLSYNLSAGYETVNNGIENYTKLHDGVAQTIYGNIVKANNFTSNAWVSYNPFTLTRVMLSANATYKDLRSTVLQRSANGWQYNIFANVTQTLPHNLVLTVFGLANRSSIQLNQQIGTIWVYGANLMASLLKDKRLTLSLQTVNPFGERSSLSVVSRNSDFRYDQTVRFPIRQVTFTVSYRIGSLKAQVKKTQRTIENNDLKQAEKSTPGSAAPTVK